MSFRFRRSIKLFPGVKINLSKSGPSLSVGPRGASINVSKRGTRATVGIPGTGLSYSQRLTQAQDSASAPAKEDGTGRAILKAVLLLTILGLVFYFFSL